ncbi:GGDEF domain-containing protein [Pararhodobacter oceanensis]|uniref:GGDEF domain-containing protein n=1 Tax=Pararhodobacter oceanensis TaxID=2172121 RepID=A0A2T8HWC4_9RHOB|nr:GGDEF domain-containing protein [Pararhodobacter oceanensis]PVH29737.1 GGDEF domain-containing protein [Pararhodobacter oceanensis]
MDGDLRQQGFQLSASALGQMMPMYLWLDNAGHIRGAGPTLQKLMGAQYLGRKFTDIFDLRRPRVWGNVLELTRAQRLRMSLNTPPHTSFKGTAVPLQSDGGVLLNLSFGYAVREAVRDHGLSDTDFAATDLAIELLYLAEAKTAVMGEVSKMATRLQGAKAIAEAQALTDALTGLGNRRAMEQAMEVLLQAENGFALIHLDLDFFKQVNDTLGHAAGDHVLVKISEILRASARGADLVARVGGDEFVILMEGVRDAAPIERVGRQILDHMQEPILFDGQHCRVALSMGAVVGPTKRDLSISAEDLMAKADVALYASKKAGRARLTLSEASGNLRELAAMDLPA